MRTLRLIRGPVERLSKDIADLEIQARRIRDVLFPVSRTLLDNLRAASVFFDKSRLGTEERLGEQWITIYHDAPLDQDQLRRFISAVLLRILGADEMVDHIHDLGELAAGLINNPDRQRRGLAMALQAALDLEGSQT